MQKKHGQISHLIADIQKYKTAINEFNRKYGFLPGDLKKTEVFNLSIHNTDGCCFGSAKVVEKKESTQKLHLIN